MKPEGKQFRVVVSLSNLIVFKNVHVFGINSQNGVFIAMTRLRAGWLKNGRRNERFISIRKFPAWLWDPTSLLFSGHRGSSPGCKVEWT